MTQEANWASSHHTLGRWRITETIRDTLQQRVVAGGRSGRSSDPYDLPSKIATKRFLLLNHQEFVENSSIITSQGPEVYECRGRSNN